ncbi:uncharacterized protein LOC126907628 isoform X2 [Daktulosphaira vitifoliae]|nr:uncharacterized protein LOC126907628 isoform X2 [Daktulosphaira vitifoliae]XP_050545004.1 uncharacterized protein LOC126907628 isoform X2 [Daktulosphaira vitifoliae]XP_050545005.1 uncharacterized protein LOC126907628 isoform X2 [Daktulosphaira vitifoliae]
MKMSEARDNHRRTLQIIRAECVVYKQSIFDLNNQMVADQKLYDEAEAAYNKRVFELESCEAEVRGKLAQVLRDRSESEKQLQLVRDKIDGDLQAKRTAGTVLAHQLDAQWRRLQEKYREFLADIFLLDKQEQLTTQTYEQSNTQQTPIQKRRFHAVADRYRRVSLRSSKSLRSLVAVGNLLREKQLRQRQSSGEDPLLIAIEKGKDGSAAVNQVWNVLDGVQRQCTRIAERVRWQSSSENTNLHLSKFKSVKEQPEDISESTIVKLENTRNAVEAGKSYIDNLRHTATVSRRLLECESIEEKELRQILFSTCKRCGCSPSSSSSVTFLKDMIARLEVACFSLFAQLDEVGSNDNGMVVETCLSKVQRQRKKEEKYKADSIKRLDNFRKAASRLMVVLEPRVKFKGVHSQQISSKYFHKNRVKPQKITTVTNKTTKTFNNNVEKEFNIITPVKSLCPPRSLSKPSHHNKK